MSYEGATSRAKYLDRFDAFDRTSRFDWHVAQNRPRFATRCDWIGRNGLNCFAFAWRIGRNYVCEVACAGRSLFSSRREEPSSLASRIVLATPFPFEFHHADLPIDSRFDRCCLSCGLRVWLLRHVDEDSQTSLRPV